MAAQINQNLVHYISVKTTTKTTKTENLIYKKGRLTTATLNYRLQGLRFENYLCK